MTLTTILSPLETLINQRTQIEAQIAKLTQQEKGLKQIEGIILDFELTRDDLIRLCDQMQLSQVDIKAEVKPEKSKQKTVIRYENPITNATWTGKGRKPNWFKIIRADEYLIAGQEHTKGVAGQLKAERNKLAVLTKKAKPSN